ncbi:hypothetical protein RND81_10G047600 [Saponaria officinalis]|uniref:DUF659 domain-containing protein n=1 Tax=Saponaria officinalis TaxID=3572 RepID=A0AAW1I0L9_SAPOF
MAFGIRGTKRSSYTRIHHHFFGAPAGQKSDIARCTAMLTNKSEFERIKVMVEESESNGGSQSLTKSTIANNNRQQLDVLVVRAFYTNVIPCNMHRNPDFINMMAGLCHDPTDYKPPSFDRVRTNLVDEVYREVDNELAAVKVREGIIGKSIPLINLVASNNRGSMFMYADDFSGKEKTGKNIANYLLEAIDEIGPSNVLQVKTDNVANLNLMFKDFDSSFEWISETYKKGKEIVKYFKNHQNAQHMFRTHFDLELLKVAKTRFGSHFLLLERLSNFNRWEKMNILLHCLGFALNPHFYHANYLKTTAPGGHPRNAPNADSEVVNGMLQDFDKIGEDETVLQGIFGSHEAMVDAVIMNPVSWWSTHGSETPELAEIDYDQPRSLVFIHSNIRLISRFTTSFKEGSSKKWDINPESDYLEDSIIRLEELRCG